MAKASGTKQKVSEKSKLGKRGAIHDLVSLLVSAALIALVIRIFLAETFTIPTGSMTPTLGVNYYIVGNKFLYGVQVPIVDAKLPGFTQPESGDITIFKYPMYRSPSPVQEFMNLVTFGFFFLDAPAIGDERDWRDHGLYRNYVNYGSGNNKNYIKRTLAAPGDTFEIRPGSDTPENDLRGRIPAEFVINGEVLQREPVSPALVRSFRTEYAATENARRGFGPTNTYGVSLANSTEYYAEVNGDNTYTVQYVWGADKSTGPREDFAYRSWYMPMAGDRLLIVPNETAYTVMILSGDATPEDPTFTYETPCHFLFDMMNGEVFQGRKCGERLDNRVEPGAQLPKETHLAIRNYLSQPVASQTQSFEYTFEQGYYFAVGDNRHDSLDSRYWGFVREDLIIGTSMIIYYPFPWSDEMSERSMIPD